MSFNSISGTDAICTIIENQTINKKSKKFNTPVIYLSENEDSVNGFKELNQTQLKNAVLQHIPNFEKERDILYISGMSGSGKSYYCRNYILQYHKIYPDNKIFLFSTCLEDPAYDDLEYIKRYELDDEFINEHFEIDNFKDMLIIFDDFDTIMNKIIKNKIREIIDMILQTGRKTHTSALITSHLATDGKQTKLILHEATSITFFLKGCGGRSINYLLDAYLGLDKNQIKKIRKIKSRAITIFKTYPQVILGEKELFII